jgi:hypothetical protein
MQAFKNRQSSDTVEAKIIFKASAVNDFRKNERFMSYQQIVDALFEMYKWRGGKSVDVVAEIKEKPNPISFTTKSYSPPEQSISAPAHVMTNSEFNSLNAERLTLIEDDYDGIAAFKKKVLAYGPSPIQRKNLIGY